MHILIAFEKRVFQNSSWDGSDESIKVIQNDHGSDKPSISWLIGIWNHDDSELELTSWNHKNDPYENRVWVIH